MHLSNQGEVARQRDAAHLRDGTHLEPSSWNINSIDLRVEPWTCAISGVNPAYGVPCDLCVTLTHQVPHRGRQRLPPSLSAIRLVGMILAEHDDEWQGIGPSAVTTCSSRFPDLIRVGSTRRDCLPRWLRLGTRRPRGSSTTISIEPTLDYVSSIPH